MSLREFEREQERGSKFKVQSFIGGELEELYPVGACLSQGSEIDMD